MVEFRLERCARGERVSRYLVSMAEKDLDRLVAAAREVAQRAYAPGSNFHVGAALQSEDGQIFVGCNVENASFGLTVCAERNAVARAVADGVRSFVRCVVYTPLAEPGLPCGACRQVLAEFGPAMEIVLVGPSGAMRSMNLAEILPQPFCFKDLESSN